MMSIIMCCIFLLYLNCEKLCRVDVMLIDGYDNDYVDDDVVMTLN